jgi:uncharacterized RmlC-like cupin family protein
MTDDDKTAPDHDRPTDPAPPMWFEHEEGCRLALADKGFESDAGWIDNLKHHGVPGTVSVLFSRAGSWRARHYHRLDSHALYIVSGEVHYWETTLGGVPLPSDTPAAIFGPREMFFTPPMRPHAMYFPIDTVMVSISDRSRTHEEHEADVVRVEVIRGR